MEVSYLIMADSITIQEFKNFFVSTMEGILEEVYDLPGLLELFERGS